MRRAAPSRRSQRETFGGVDVVGHTREELYERAKALDVRGRSRMTKAELARGDRAHAGLGPTRLVGPTSSGRAGASEALGALAGVVARR